MEKLLRDEEEDMNELFPIVSGVVVGIALGGFMPQLRLLLGIVAAVVLGIIATIISGEYLISWEFLLIDIPLVGICSAAAVLVSRTARKRWDSRSV